MTPTEPPSAAVRVAALYRFTPFEDCAGLRESLLEACRALGIRGTLLLAPEGINGTIAGTPAALDAALAVVRRLPGCAELEVKYATASAMPFDRMKVRLKREIVTMGEPAIDPRASVGTYVEPQDWNALISDPDTLVIDTRNDYEVAVGTFAGAIDPATASFREFPAWFRRERERLLGEGEAVRPRRVAMFCTGGIRCEKSTALLKGEGVGEVYHLKGGILNYLEKVPADQSLWQGECYVFDHRVSVGHGLAEGSYGACRACGRPVRKEPGRAGGPGRCPHCATD
ncbi:MAG TPA: rhodanese-related sulfurtransferase [Novosphingobium sp.]